MRSTIFVLLIISYFCFLHSELQGLFAIENIESVKKEPENFVLTLSDHQGSSQTVQLKDIAICRGNQIICTGLLQIPVFTFRLPQQKMRINRDDILQAIENIGAKTKVTFSGPGSIRIKHKGISLPTWQAKQIINKRLSKNPNIRLETLRWLEPVKVFSGPFSIDWDEQFSLIDLARNLSPEVFTFKITQGNFTRRIKAWVKLAVLKKVLSASKTVLRNGLLDESNTEYTWVKIRKGLRQPWITDFAQLEGKSARVLIAQGETITVHKLQKKILMKRGSKIDVIIHQGSLTVKSKGQAMEDGYMGQRLKIRMGSKTLFGKPLSNSMAEVRF